MKEKNREKTLKSASVVMAAADIFPVIFFALSGIMTADIFGSKLFTAGIILFIIAGAGKVVWKFILAIKKTDTRLLSGMFRPVMLAGLVLIAVSLIVNGSRVNWDEVWKNISRPPCSVLFIIGAAGYALMTVIEATFDLSKPGVNWAAQTVNTFAQFFVMAGVLLIWFGRGYSADYTTLSLPDDIVVEECSFGQYIHGSGSDKALIFYPGARVSYKAYTPFLVRIAENGVDCFLCDVPNNIALFGKNMAGGIISDYSYDKWFIGGHSLGGYYAAEYADEHQDKIAGVVYFASYPSKAEFGASGFPMIYIYGSEDGVLNFESVRNCNAGGINPEVCIEGGNHAYFGSYGEQDGDNPALISREEQWEQAAKAVRGFAE